MISASCGPMLSLPIPTAALRNQSPMEQSGMVMDLQVLIPVLNQSQRLPNRMAPVELNELKDSYRRIVGRMAFLNPCSPWGGTRLILLEEGWEACAMVKYCVHVDDDGVFSGFLISRQYFPNDQRTFAEVMTEAHSSTIYYSPNLQQDQNERSEASGFVTSRPELIEITNEKVAVAKEKLKEARSRQKSYADKHRRDLEFQVGDRVFLKVSPFRGVKRFGIKGKLSPRFIGPFEILERIGEVSYRLALPPQLSHVHDVFHVSLLRGYHYHPLHVASYPFDQIQPDMSLSEEPESILDRQERVMRNKVIPFVKILWKNHPEREATWETEESMRASYPHFFV
ncbi:putative nucleotidyltransferase, ribonuclease H [Tanacetum coccineum]